MAAFAESVKNTTPPTQQAPAQKTVWQMFAAYLIDKCEGEVITEEGLQRSLADMLADPAYAAAFAQPALVVQKPAFYGFMDAHNCCVNLCFTPHAPGGPNNEWATAYYTEPFATPDLSRLNPENAQQMREWISDGSFAQRAVDTMFELSEEITALKKAPPAVRELTHDEWDAWQDRWQVALEREALDDLRAVLATPPSATKNGGFA